MFDSLQAVDPVVRWLWMSLPWPEAEDAFHRVRCGLDEVVQVPFLVDVLRGGDSELQAYGETGVLWLHACRGDRLPDRVLPGFLVSSGVTGGPPWNVDSNKVTLGHAHKHRTIM